MNLLKILGIVASVGGAAFSILGSFVSEKQMEETIDKKISERLKAKE